MHHPPAGADTALLPIKSLSPMRKATPLFPLATALLFTTAVVLFFGLRYPHHLHYQEQYQLFQFTGSYFRSVVRVPGGLADWLGRFLTQCFFFAWFGASVIGGLLTLLALTLWLSVRRRGRSPLLLILSFLPSVLCGLFLCDENALLGAPVALWMAWLAVAGIVRIRPFKGRLGTVALAIPIMYMVSGPLAMVVPLLVVIDTWSPSSRRSKQQATLLFLLTVVLSALTLFVAWRLFPYPLKNLCLGIHYFRFPRVLPLWIWLAAGSSLLVYAFAASPLLTRHKRALLIGLTAFAALMAAAGGGVLLCADFSKETSMKYDYMARMHTWNKMINEAHRRQPTNPLTVTCLNIALSKTGRMGDTLFDYYQNGPEGLLPSFQRDFTSPLATAEAWYLMGMINTAQRYTFEAQEAIPDYQKSARCYKRLAETNLINGDLAVARKYLIPLTHTLYYRRWALQTLTLLADEAAVDAHPEYGVLRRMRLRQHDFLFSSSETDSMLGLLLTENPSNVMARDYLMAWCLLTKNLKRFEECLPLLPFLQMPRSYQEAFLLRWVQTHSDFDGLPPFIDRQHVERISAFMHDSQRKADVSLMRRRYGNTYWYYYIYRYNPTEP